MGNTFWILVWDAWGCGLDMINPRLLEVYNAERCYRSNSFSCDNPGDIEAFLKEHKIEERFGDYYKVIE